MIKYYNININEVLGINDTCNIRHNNNSDFCILS